MRRTLVLPIIFLILAVSTLTSWKTATAAPRTIVVPDNYPTLQQALDQANPGDTVFARAGIYNESLILSKTVSLLGENRQTTLIVGPVGPVLLLNANNITVSGFTIQSRSITGAYMQNGITVNSNSNLITNNVITANSYHGLYLNNSNQNTIKDNTISLNYWCGIVLSNSDNNKISNNTIIQNLKQNNGIGIILADGSDFNTIERNTISKNDGGIGFTVNSSPVGSNDNLVRNNTISQNGHDGIFLYDPSQRNRIESNEITRNGGGIHLSSAPIYTVIVENTVSYNSYGGIGFDQAPFNTAYHNNFIGNTPQVWYFSKNSTWDNGYPSGGNFWSDYKGTDANGDGIGDTAYLINSDNQDRFPLMAPYGTPKSRDIITNASLMIDPARTGVGQPVSLNFSISPPPPSSSDRFNGLMVTVTRPDGTVQTLGPFQTDTEGSSFIVYTPSQTGTYSFRLAYPGQIFSNGQTYLAASNLPATLIVQQEPKITASPTIEPTFTPAQSIEPTPTPAPTPSQTTTPTDTPTPTSTETTSTPTISTTETPSATESASPTTPTNTIEQGQENQTNKNPNVPPVTLATILVAIVSMVLVPVLLRRIGRKSRPQIKEGRLFCLRKYSIHKDSLQEVF